jgi:phosphoribosylanthranilate isomerase
VNTLARIKICCISTIGEARMAIRYGASAIGLVSEMPSGPGVISEDTILEIAEYTPPGISTFLLTSKQSIDDIIEQHRRCRTNAIQLCDRLMIGTHTDLKKALPGIKIVQVVHVNGEESIKEAKNAAKDADAILLDSGNQNQNIKELGGTGKTHDWSISTLITRSISKPVYLAGGLNSENVVAAIKQVQPFGVDVCSGVRTNGKIDESKLRRFFAVVRSTEL